MAELPPTDLSEVPVKLEPEPENPYDNMAISFKCIKPSRKWWNRIGYVVHADVHNCLAEDKVMDVRFGWVKYRVDWIHSGPPGFFAGIDIT